MTKGNPKWEQFEHSVQNLLNLRSTPGSGNQWHDVSDGVSKPDDPYKIMVDCKFTEKSAFSLAQKVLAQWWTKSTMLGYRFALPVRFDGDYTNAEDRISPKEWVTIPLEDYAELVEIIRTFNGPKRCGVKPPGEYKLLCCRRFGHFNRHDNGEIEWSM